MRKRTNVEIAYSLIKERNEAVPFYEIWQHIVNEHEYSEAEGIELISKFYTALMMDGRFVNSGDNVWNLRERVKFDEIALSMSEAYSDEDEVKDSEDDDDDAPEILYFDDEGAEEEAEDRIKEIISGEEN
ncbi:MAG: DNA-directed RNA polymerase subunit delta [Bacilli bacterium]|nr:DNA-directed RNA polymerase subunit delta [Bacilli bacterium]